MIHSIDALQIHPGRDLDALVGLSGDEVIAPAGVNDLPPEATLSSSSLAAPSLLLTYISLYLTTNFKYTIQKITNK